MQSEKLYELKQIKVVLKLTESEPLYSTEQINSPDKATEVMAQALAQLDRECCCIVNLDGANHPINYNIVSIGDGSQTQVPVQNVFKAAILSNASGIMLFHNHPSGSLIASREDILLTRRLVEAGKLMNIPVVDHIIIAGRTGRHYSFRENNADLFSLMEKEESSLHEPQAKLDPDKLMVRPTYRYYGVYESIGMNRARVIFEGSKEECYEKIRELRDRYLESKGGDRFIIYQLKEGESLHDIRFESLEALKKANREVDSDNYESVYEAPLKPGTTLDDLYFQFNVNHPLDFRGHSLSVSDVIVLYRDDTEEAFYVDRFGFIEVPEFLAEKEITFESCRTAEKIAAEVDRLAYEYDASKYNEIVKDRRAQVESIAADIKNGDIEYIDKFLKALASDSMREGIIDMFGKGVQPSDSVRVQMMCKAKEVQEQLAEYSSLSKGKDNVPPSLPPAGDEKNAPPQEKAEHIAERNKTHSRISMKEKLAEKKAEIAVRPTKSHDAQKAKKPPGIGVED